jgi:FHS family L-fucose permease-like MFS transporter
MGKLTSKGSAVMVMAVTGGVPIPPIQGLLADRIGLRHALIVLGYAISTLLTLAP